MKIFETQLNVRSDQQITGEDKKSWSDKLLEKTQKYFDIQNKVELAVLYGSAAMALALIVLMATMEYLPII